MTKPVAIVTGGSRGVGAEVSKLLASKGWNIAITCSSSIEAANEVSKECETLGAETIVLKADVSQPESCAQTVNETLKKWDYLNLALHALSCTCIPMHLRFACIGSLADKCFKISIPIFHQGVGIAFEISINCVQ